MVKREKDGRGEKHPVGARNFQVKLKLTCDRNIKVIMPKVFQYLHFPIILKAFVGRGSDLFMSSTTLCLFC